jgi:hypothetical protein
MILRWVQLPLLLQVSLLLSYPTCAIIIIIIIIISRSRWQRRLMRGSAVARLLGLQVWISPGPWISFCCRYKSLHRADYLSRGDLPSVVCLSECNRESSIRRKPWPTGGCCVMDDDDDNNNNNNNPN